MSSFENEPKYLACVRALALLTGVAGSVSACGGIPDASSSGPGSVSAAADAGDASSPPPVYDGGFHGVRAHTPDGCDVGGGPASRGALLVAGVAGTGLIARRRRRPDVP
ncbi:MAG: MYXO-CTERM sorting domain-containing protein [Polyangia bacterium]